MMPKLRAVIDAGKTKTKHRGGQHLHIVSITSVPTNEESEYKVRRAWDLLFSTADVDPSATLENTSTVKEAA